MNKRIKKLWVDALRSGEYRQARGQLRSKQNGFCCLGVLCNIHAQEHPEIAAKQMSSNYMGQNAILPIAVREWAGLKTSDPLVKYSNKHGEKRTNLADLNDNKRFNFEKIADAIDKSL